jgi:hypothetical protein
VQAARLRASGQAPSPELEAPISAATPVASTTGATQPEDQPSAASMPSAVGMGTQATPQGPAPSGNGQAVWQIKDGKWVLAPQEGGTDG